MQPHEQRVVDEKKELDVKIEKLSAFVDSSPVYKGLDDADKQLLVDQLSHMKAYSDILGQRIGRFKS